MDVKELRKGNIVYQDDELINGITTLTIHKFDLSFIILDPIPLTEEWFLKLGFKETGDFLWFGNFSYNKETKIFHWFGVIIHDIFIKYVHQLQNLYFALTGTELEIK